MIRINQIKVPIHHSEHEIEQKIRKALRLRTDQTFTWEVVKKSIDARKKPDLMYIYSVDVTIADEASVLKKVHDNNIMSTNVKNYCYPTHGTAPLKNRPIIVGAGPAGLFCGYALAAQGYYPIIVERGKKVEERTADVQKFWETGVLDVHSNVQFGEGGAGAFSDGKLNTLIKDPVGRNRFVLETFVRFGAPERILYENKPHIGTDILAVVIAKLRKTMEQMGAEFRFEHCMTDISCENGRIKEVCLNGTEWLKTDCCILAPGHSARDTFAMLQERNLSMSAKAFAVGFRVEHPQEMINRSQYGDLYYRELPAAPYKVTANLWNGRGVYSFCMCPGGYVVNASSEEGHLAVNGMSYSDRAGSNANSAIIVSVTPDDFAEYGTDALAGVRFQEHLEERAFSLVGGKIPQQLFGDYVADRPSVCYGAFASQTKGIAALCNLRGLLPEELEQSFIDGMHHFGHIVPDFDGNDAILSGIESRTSSPVRITRGDAFTSNVDGIYPCGEGAGYAGGIMSAAMDGLKVAEAVIRRFAPRNAG